MPKLSPRLNGVAMIGPVVLSFPLSQPVLLLERPFANRITALFSTYGRFLLICHLIREIMIRESRFSTLQSLQYATVSPNQERRPVGTLGGIGVRSENVMTPLSAYQYIMAEVNLEKRPWIFKKELDALRRKPLVDISSFHQAFKRHKRRSKRLLPNPQNPGQINRRANKIQKRRRLGRIPSLHFFLIIWLNSVTFSPEIANAQRQLASIKDFLRMTTREDLRADIAQRRIFRPALKKYLYEHPHTVTTHIHGVTLLGYALEGATLLDL